jgi:hypothetical protein
MNSHVSENTKSRLKKGLTLVQPIAPYVSSFKSDQFG